jgi:GxxExxY protein
MTTPLPAHNVDRAARGVIACARAIYESLGPDRAVAEYEEALARLLQEKLLKFARQYPVGIPFYGPQDRGFYADFFVEGWVLLELKAVDELTAEQADQALNYLRESGAEVCLLINFGRRRLEMRKILPSGEMTDALMASVPSTSARPA